MGHSKSKTEGKFTAIQDYLKKIETFQINNLTLHLQALEEKQQIKPRVSRRKEIIKITAEFSDTETKRKIQKINKSRSWSFKKDKQNQKAFSQAHQRERERKRERGPK